MFLKRHRQWLCLLNIKINLVISLVAITHAVILYMKNTENYFTVHKVKKFLWS